MKQQLINAARSSGIVDADTLSRFLEQHDNEARIDLVLIDSALFAEDEVLKLFAAALDVPYIDQINPADVPVEFITDIPAGYAQQHSLVATSLTDSSVTVATGIPLNTYPLDNVGKVLGRQFEKMKL